MKFAHLFSTLLLGAFSFSCVSTLPPPTNEPSPFQGMGLVETHQNGLTTAERENYYHMDFGVQYLPTDLLMSLSRPVMPADGGVSLKLYDQLLLDKPERLGLYPDFLNPAGPPLGITSSSDPSYLPMAGINCATCHTTLMVKDGKGVLVDGGSSNFAIDRFVSEMVFSLVYTALSPTEFFRMYDRYKARHRSANEIASHHAAIDELVGCAEAQALRAEAADKLDDSPSSIEDEATAFIAKIQAKADEKKDDDIAIDASLLKSPLTASGAYPTEAQLDSAIEVYAYLVKRIIFLSKVAQYGSGGAGSPGLGRSNPWSVVQNMLAANASSLHIGLSDQDSSKWLKSTNGSAKAPNIWGFNAYRGIFWTGVTNSVMERNFAQGILLLTDFDWGTFETTVSIRSMHEIMEKYAYKMTPPVWPAEVFGAPDAALADRGKVVFKEQCLTCHTPKTSQPGPAGSEQRYENVGTDRSYYDGQARSFYGKDLFADALGPWLSAVKSRAYVREKVAEADRTTWEEGRLPVVWRGPGVNEVEAKVLWGIWAAAPYLHNGAISSIRELLTPPAKRLQSFWVGSVTFDPKALGFTPDKMYYSSQIDAKMQGNGTDGHAFGVDLPEADKNALIEFLKVYGPTTKFE